MTITAKYEGQCVLCGGVVHVGDQVNWSRGTRGVSHVSCPENAEPKRGNGTGRPASAKQRSLLESLVAERDVGDDTMFQTSLPRDLDRATASQLIERLLEYPKKEGRSTQDAGVAGVPAGRYAIRWNTGWKLLRVWRGTRNPSIVQVYEVKGTERGERLDSGSEATALEAIAVDPGRAAREFGHRTGSCSRCGLELDVNLSRKLGVGPVCIKHWYSHETATQMRAQAREELRGQGLDPEAKLDHVEVAA